MQGLIDRIKPKFQSNLHSFGQWLLYPQGWQIGTLDADNPVYVAPRRHRRQPGDSGLQPRFSGRHALRHQRRDDRLRRHDRRHDRRSRRSSARACRAPASCSPTTRRWSQAEFQRTLPFHLGLARSATHPDDPVSPVGIDTAAFYLDQDEIDPQNGHQSLFDFRFAVSYGDPQEVRVLARRSLGHVRLKYRINGGRSARVRPASGPAGSATARAAARTTTCARAR